MGALDRLFKHTIIYGIATVVPRLLTVLLTPLLVNYLPSKDAFGEVSIVFSWILICNVVLTYGMETAFFRFYSDPAVGKKAMKTALAAVFFTTCVAAMVAFLSLDGIAQLTAIGAVYWQWVIGVIALDTLTVIPFALMRAQGKTMHYAVVKLANVFVSVGLSALFFMVLPQWDAVNKYLPTDQIALFFIAFFAASFMTFLIVSRPYFSRWQLDFGLWKKMLVYGAPILVAGLAFAINETFDKILLQWLLPQETAKEQVGIYSACYRLAIGMTLYATAFKLGVEPFFFSESRSENAKYMYAQITKIFVLLGSVALFVYIVMIDVIKPILVPDPAYWDAMNIVPPVLIAFLFFGIYQSLSVWYKVTDKTRYGAMISVIGAGLTIGLNILFIPTIGFMASAITTCVAYATMMVLSYLIGKNHYPVPYDMKSIMICLMTAISFSLLYFYYFREILEVHSLKLYSVGAVMTVALLTIIWLGNKPFLKSIIAKKWK